MILMKGGKRGTRGCGKLDGRNDLSMNPYWGLCSERSIVKEAYWYEMSQSDDSARGTCPNAYSFPRSD